MASRNTAKTRQAPSGQSANGATLTQTVETPKLAESDSQRPPVTLRADGTREYIAGGAYAWTSQFWRSLPWVIDDLTAEFGDDLYERMGLDAQVQSDCQTWKLAVLQDGVTFLPAKSKGQDGYDKAVEQCDFIKRCFARLQEDLILTLTDMLAAFEVGNKVAEINRKVADTGDDAGKVVLDSIKVKPRHAVVFVVDVFMNVIGVMGLIPGEPAPLQLLSWNQENAPKNLLPRRKVAILTYAKRNNDPRGRSALRAAYTPWLFKVQMLPEWLKNLAQFGGSSVWGTTPENAQRMAQIDAAGNVMLDGSGAAIMVDPIRQLYDALVAYRNGTAGAFPFGTELHVEAPPGDGSAFDRGIKFANGEISKVILGQTLATQEGEHQARAAASVHDDIRALRVAYGKFLVAGMLKTDIVDPLIEENFGVEAVELAPRVSLTETEQQDRDKLWTAVGNLMRSGYLDPTQYPELDAILSLPERSEESILKAIERQNAAPTNGAGDPGSQGDGGDAGDSGDSEGSGDSGDSQDSDGDGNSGENDNG